MASLPVPPSPVNKIGILARQILWALLRSSVIAADFPNNTSSGGTALRVAEETFLIGLSVGIFVRELEQHITVQSQCIFPSGETYPIDKQNLFFQLFRSQVR